MRTDTQVAQVVLVVLFMAQSPRLFLETVLTQLQSVQVVQAVHRDPETFPAQTVQILQLREPVLLQLPREAAAVVMQAVTHHHRLIQVVLAVAVPQERGLLAAVQHNPVQTHPAILV
jgi:hypothetical protein